MIDNVIRKIAVCFLSAALVIPGTVCGAAVPKQKTTEEIKKILSGESKRGATIKTSDAVVLSLLSAAVAGAGVAYAGSMWRHAKTNAAKDAVIKELMNKVTFLNNALEVEAREQARLLRVLDSQADLFAKMIRFRGDVSSKEIQKAQLVGFNRGYDAAFKGAEELQEVYFGKGYRAGYGQKTVEQFMEGKSVVLPRSGKLVKVKADDLIKALREELVRLHGQIGSLRASAAMDKQIISLVSEAGQKLALLDRTTSAQETATLRHELSLAASHMNNVPVTGARKELLKSFSTSISRRLKGGAGALGVGAVILFSAAAIATAYKNPPHEISHNRLGVQRALQRVYESKPELFATQVFIFKEEYGVNFVSSVLYENQHYLPLLEAQLEVISSKGLLEMLSIFKGNHSQEQNKQLLLESLSVG